MPVITVSPGNQTWSSRREKLFFFHAGDGTMPLCSPLMSRPVGAPKPNAVSPSAMFWMPIAIAS